MSPFVTQNVLGDNAPREPDARERDYFSIHQLLTNFNPSEDFRIKQNRCNQQDTDLERDSKQASSKHNYPVIDDNEMQTNKVNETKQSY